ncbi:MAG: hypothetical protein AABZ64_04355 [Nitrospinota bacterium]
MQNLLVWILSSPLVVLAVSAAVFVALAWLALPFALYGVRRRLDRIAEGLERIQALLEPPPPAPAEPPGTAAREEAPAGAGPEEKLADTELDRMRASAGTRKEPAEAAVEAAPEEGPEDAGPLATFRETMERLVPGLQERVLDRRRVDYVHRRGWGREFPCLRVKIEGGRLQAALPLGKLAEAYPRFSAEQFAQYVEIFLGEKYGVFPASAPGSELFVVTMEPDKKKGIEIFLGIVQEQLLSAMSEDEA